MWMKEASPFFLPNILYEIAGVHNNLDGSLNQVE